MYMYCDMYYVYMYYIIYINIYIMCFLCGDFHIDIRLPQGNKQWDHQRLRYHHKISLLNSDIYIFNIDNC